MALKYSQQKYNCGRYEAVDWDAACKLPERYTPCPDSVTAWSPCPDEVERWRAVE